MARPFVERFFAQVDTEGPVAKLRPDLGRCWMWTGSVNGSGYPQIRRDGEVISGRKAGWEIASGETAPRGLQFEMYACGVQTCVNPAHVRPIIATDPRLDGGAVVRVRRWVADLYRRRVEVDPTGAVCLNGHPLSRTKVEVPGGWGCRECRRETRRGPSDAPGGHGPVGMGDRTPTGV